MNYIEEYQMLRRQIANYAAGERIARAPAGGRVRDTTVEKWRQAELRIFKLRDYFERHGIAYTA